MIISFVYLIKRFPEHLPDELEVLQMVGDNMRGWIRSEQLA